MSLLYALCWPCWLATDHLPWPVVLHGLMDPLCLHLTHSFQLMRKILCTRDHGYGVLSQAAAKARQGNRVGLQTEEDDVTLIIESQHPAPGSPQRATAAADAGAADDDDGAAPDIMMSQEGDVLDQQAAAAAAAQQQATQQKKPRGKPPKGQQRAAGQPAAAAAKSERLPLELVEALLAAYPQHIVQEHARKQQQQQQPGSEASSEDSGHAGASSSSHSWLPKEAFIRQLVASCCEGERQEKVVIFSQVGAGRGPSATAAGAQGVCMAFGQCEGCPAGAAGHYACLEHVVCRRR
jgi:hypothetical protein